MSTSANELPAPRIVLTIELSVSDMDALANAILQISGQIGHAERIAAIRLDEVACRAELDVVDRPVDQSRLH